ncbi:hypothetical protein O6H91_Y361600 [Diphasiastrum complanatum]|nr:hypothetical protein O6H91_Y361600 [Diphasiastrum complanatum]
MTNWVLAANRLPNCSLREFENESMCIEDQLERGGMVNYHKKFPGWLSKKLSEQSKNGIEVDNTLFELAQGPLQVARSYSVMNIKGYHFRTEKVDIGKVTQDSRVAANFDTWSRSSVKDKNPIMEKL